MSFFKIPADLLHLFSFFVLIRNILLRKSTKELSYGTQEIYLVVFCCRYLDLFLYFISLYNSLMKLAYISCTIAIIFLMRVIKPYCLVRLPSILSNQSIWQECLSVARATTLKTSNFRTDCSTSQL